MKIRLIALTIVSMAILIALIFFWQALSYNGRIYPGTRVNGYDVGGLSPTQAGAYLKERLPNPRYLEISTYDFHRRLNLAEYRATPNYVYAVKKAYMVGRGGSWVNNLSTVLLNRFQLTSVRVDYLLDTKKLIKELKTISIQIDQPPVNARRVVSGKDISLIHGQTGYKLKVDKAANIIVDALADNRRQVELPVVETPPNIDLAYLKKQNIDTLLGEFQTTLNPQQKNRNINIAIASKKIDDIMVSPGTIFSFNDVVGSRSQANGFQLATEIRNGNLAKGIGGGICQLATTLYNAFMLAGLPTVERHIHSNYIAAYPTGRDASIAEGRYDLRFKNDTNGYVLIKAMADSNRLIVRIYGPKIGRVNSFSEPRLEKSVPYKIINETDDTLPPGITMIMQKGIAGRSISLERSVKSPGGKLLFKESISSRYQPRPEIIKSGPPESY